MKDTLKNTKPKTSTTVRHLRQNGLKENPLTQRKAHYFSTLGSQWNQLRHEKVWMPVSHAQILMLFSGMWPGFYSPPDVCAQESISRKREWDWLILVLFRPTMSFLLFCLLDRSVSSFQVSNFVSGILNCRHHCFTQPLQPWPSGSQHDMWLILVNYLTS